MADQEQLSDKAKVKESARVNALWHDAIPMWLPICLTIASCMIGSTWYLANDRAKVLERLDGLEDGLKQVRDTQKTMGAKLDKIGQNQEKVMFILHVPLEDLPDVYIYPPQTGKKRSDPFTLPQPEGTLGKKDGRSFYDAPQPIAARN
jgi:hypothetical protein